MAIEERASVCTFDCPDTCSLTVSVEEGRIVKVRGSDAAPYTAGVICNKVARDMADFVHGPRRLLYPLRRIGPKGSEQFERISWDSALDEIHERVSDIIARSGPESVMPLNYAGPHGFLAGDSMSSRFFNRLGATQLYRRALCGGVPANEITGLSKTHACRGVGSALARPARPVRRAAHRGPRQNRRRSRPRGAAGEVGEVVTRSDCVMGGQCRDFARRLAAHRRSRQL
jgi:hypothetical protein